MSTCDPSGKYCVPAAIDPHVPGAKLDHTKYRPGLVLKGFARALEAASHVGTFGANKYTDDGWVAVPDGEKRYTDALWRHLLADAQGDRNDSESGLPHIHHALWNLMAIVELQCRNTSNNIDMNSETSAE